MEKKIIEKLVVIDKQPDNFEFSFPISISPRSLEIERTPVNEREYYHVTCLIVPILRAEKDKILIVDKSEKEKRKSLNGSNNIPCFDVIGGHFSADEIPLKELEAGKLSLKSALKQAFRELTEELKICNEDIPPFRPEDLVFLDFYSYESETNKELSLAFGLYLGYSSDNYEACDDAVVDGKRENILLRLESFSYEELMEMWCKNKTTGDYRIADGLGRLLERGDLPEVLCKTELSIRSSEKVDITGSGKSLSSNIGSVCGKLKSFDIKYSITDLLRGYMKNNNQFVCLECEFTSRIENEVVSHWQLCHKQNRENRFIRLANIGALDFTYTEKRAFFHMVFSDMSYKEIAEELGAGSPITINSMRQRFDSQVDKAKAILMLNDMLPPIKKYKKTYYKELMPALNEDSLAITGFYSKERLHSSADYPLAHATVISIICKRNSEGIWRFLVADKANSISAVTNSLGRKFLLDFVGGGHVEISDLTSEPALLADLKKGKTDEVIRRYIGTHLTNEIFKRTAIREFNEEVKIRSAKINPEFIELCDLPFNGPTLIPFGGWNKEVISKVYLSILPQSLNEQNIRVWESWEDSVGQIIKREYVSQFFSWDELDSLYDDGDNFMDGISRVIEAYRRDPELKDKMFSILNKEENTFKQKTRRREQ